jgi:hypothetical protein
MVVGLFFWRNEKMSWEKFKAAVKAAGINAVVRHGKGTAWSWLKINIGRGDGLAEHQKDDNGYCGYHNHCPACLKAYELRKKVLKIAQEVTGRSGEYNGEINVSTQDEWKEKLGKSVPIVQSPDCI